MSECNKPIEILYQDEHLVAINKPAGLLVHRSHIDRYETEFAVQQVRDQLSQWVYPVHRLDKPTSGILLFALHPHIAQALGEQFQQGLVHKRYHAITRGWLKTDSLAIDYALAPVRDKIADKDKRPDPPRQEAQTSLLKKQQFALNQAIGRYPQTRFQLLEVIPSTGRKHQIRRHCKHVFHPIMGDTRYGEGRFNRFFREEVAVSELMLSATQLDFQHPISKAAISIVCPLSSPMEKALAYLAEHDRAKKLA